MREKLKALRLAAARMTGIKFLQEPPNPPPPGEPMPATRGDQVFILREREPHISYDVLTPMQLATIFKAQDDYRKLRKEPLPTLEESRALVHFVEQVQIHTRVVELLFAGHLAVDLRDSRNGFKFVRRWGADELQAIGIGVQSEATAEETPSTAVGARACPKCQRICTSQEEMIGHGCEGVSRGGLVL